MFTPLNHYVLCGNPYRECWCNSGMTNTKCEINVQLGEKVLFASTEEQSKLAEAAQESHYVSCTHPTCQENKAFLIKAGLFQMNEAQQKVYDAKQALLEAEEDNQ